MGHTERHLLLQDFTHYKKMYLTFYYCKLEAKKKPLEIPELDLKLCIIRITTLYIQTPLQQQKYKQSITASLSPLIDSSSNDIHKSSSIWR